MKRKVVVLMGALIMIFGGIIISIVLPQYEGLIIAGIFIILSIALLEPLPRG